MSWIVNSLGAIAQQLYFRVFHPGMPLQKRMMWAGVVPVAVIAFMGGDLLLLEGLALGLAYLIHLAVEWRVQKEKRNMQEKIRQADRGGL